MGPFVVLHFSLSTLNFQLSQSFLAKAAILYHNPPTKRKGAQQKFFRNWRTGAKKEKSYASVSVPEQVVKRNL